MQSPVPGPSPPDPCLPLPRHCVDLFLDFVNIFRELMIILGMNEVSPCWLSLGEVTH